MAAPAPPPAEVYIYVLPPVRKGKYSLMVYPRRLGDTVVFFTPPELKAENPRGAREVLWIPSGLQPGQVLTITEKANSPGKDHFGNIPQIHSHTPMQLSGPVLKGPGHGHSVWSYEITLSDHTGVLASLDPDVVVVPDP